MSERDVAITSKAVCYGISAFAVTMCAVFHMMGSLIAFELGLYAGVTLISITELFIYIPDKKETSR